MPPRNRNWTFKYCLPILPLLFIGGCQWFVDDADREVYRLLGRRQQESVGESSNVRISDGKTASSDLAGPKKHDPAYDFVPHPVDAEVPESFKRTTTQPAAPKTQPSNTSQTTTSEPATQPAGKILSLTDVLDYAFQHSRDYQTAKEDLYLAALDLTLERHLWTPRLFGEIQSEYANYGQVRNFDHAMSAVAQVGVEQNLPYGGQVTAQVVNTLMRDLTNHITTGETGQILLEADIPLLRGAGRVAYESRYQAERDLIYAVRTFERFRRSLAVDIADDYFNLQLLRQIIDNADKSIKFFAYEAKRAEARWEAGWEIRLEVGRAEQKRLEAISGKINAVETYQTSLDQFKIRIGMPIETPVDVPYPKDPTAKSAKTARMEADSLEEAIRMPDLTEKEAIRVALKYRLDLLNNLDTVDDARRGVWVAKNNLLPDLDAFGSVRLGTDSSKLDMLKYNHERTTWRAGLTLELPLDRKQERNALRSAVISKKQAERDYDLAKDSVRFQVRRAIRRVQQADTSLDIEILNRDLALKRRQAAQIRLRKGTISNREVTDAEEDLLRARNRLAGAQADLKLAILQFRRDTGTLRIDRQGKWPATEKHKPG